MVEAGEDSGGDLAILLDIDIGSSGGELDLNKEVIAGQGGNLLDLAG